MTNFQMSVGSKPDKSRILYGSFPVSLPTVSSTRRGRLLVSRYGEHKLPMALNAGGRTIAVLAAGLDIIYPSDNLNLAKRIVESGQGALITEFPLGVKPSVGISPLILSSSSLSTKA